MNKESDSDLISFSLDLWANYIETYYVSISADDARNKIYSAKKHYEPNILNTYQKVLVGRLRQLALDYRKGEK